MDNLKEHTEKIGCLMEEMSKGILSFNLAFSKLSKEDQKLITPNSDLQKAMRMVNTGSFDENFITQIKTKYGG